MILMMMLLVMKNFKSEESFVLPLSSGTDSGVNNMANVTMRYTRCRVYITERAQGYRRGANSEKEVY